MRKFVRGVALVAVAVLVPTQVGLAAALPRALRGIEVSEGRGTTVIDVQMEEPFRYLKHSPASWGTVLRIRLRSEVGASRYDGEPAAGPFLILRFEKPVAFSVSQGRDLESIRVTVRAESARKQAPWGGALAAADTDEARAKNARKRAPQLASRSDARTDGMLASPTGGRIDRIMSKVRGAMMHEDEGYARRGLYLGVLPVIAFEGFQSEIEDLVPGIDVNVDDSWGLNGRIGYRIHPRLAVEAQGEWYSEYNVDLLGVEAAEFEGWSAVLLGKAYLLTDRFQPYALAGWGYLDVELSDKLGLGLSENSSGSVIRWGGGIDIYATRGFLLNLEASYALPLGSLDNLDFWTLGVGLQYRF
jgi:opacity protein-like surface antigen